MESKGWKLIMNLRESLLSHSEGGNLDWHISTMFSLGQPWFSPGITLGK